MKKFTNIVLMINILLLGVALQARAAVTLDVIQQSQQLIVVITPSWQADKGKLYLFERASTQQPWQAIGQPAPVFVGKNGMGWAPNEQHEQLSGPIKQEGDGKSPAGIFKLGAAFGHNPITDQRMKLQYIPLKPTTICVADPHSRYYGRIIDSNQIAKQDWDKQKVEMMSHYTQQYAQGIVIDYNNDGTLPTGGSCIFLHIHSAAGTLGCTAMTAAMITKLWQWLAPDVNPLLIQLPKESYLQLKKTWELPVLG